MKKISTMAALLFASVLLVCCGRVSGSDETGTRSYKEMTEIARFNKDGAGIVLGMSPDGEKAVISSSAGQIGVIDIKSQEAVNEMESKEASSGGKRVLWLDDSSFILGDASYNPRELIMMSSSDISVYSLDGEPEQITDENTEDSFFENGTLIYSPTCSADKKSVIYSTMDSGSLKICKADIRSGEKETLYITDNKADATQAIELKAGLLLCEANGPRPGENNIFICNTETGEETSLEGIIDEEASRSLYEIKDWSDDRRTVLLNKWVYLHNNPDSLVLQKCMVVSFDKNFKDFEVKTFAFQLKAEDSDAPEAFNALLTDENGIDILAFESIMSHDGQYLIVRQDKALEYNQSNILDRKQQIVLYDLKQNKEYTLYEADEHELFGISSSLIVNSQGMSLSRDDTLMVWFMDGYRFYQLK